MIVQVLNSKGQPIVLNAQEQLISNALTKAANDLGFQIDVTTLTQIVAKVTEQRFFEVLPADFLPIKVGNGAFMTSLLTYRSFSLGSDFSDGVIDVGSNGGQLSTADAGIDGITVPIKTWAKQATWTLPELMHASKSGNWDIVEAKAKARKKNWDLGLQEVAFLGLAGNSAIKGLLTQSDVTVNTSVINKPISSMSETELNAFVAAVYEAYRLNAARTAKPTAFVLPESDFNGLASMSSATYPLKSKLAILKEAFGLLTGMGESFKIQSIPYADVAFSKGLLTYPRYLLGNLADEETVRMDIPVDYTATMANTINGFSFQNVGYGQFTGAKAYRPKEMLYFDNDGP